MAPRVSFSAVPRAAKKAEPTDQGPELSFEEALAKLESTIESMESGELTLEETLKSFEQGSKLAKICASRLDAAEARIQKLEKTSTGEDAATPISLEDEAR